MTMIADNLSKPHVKRWTKQEYNTLVSRGFIQGQSTFLYQGELVEKLAEGELVPRLWTKQEYNEKVERGFLSKQRVYLYRGELIQVPPMGTLHAWGITNVNTWMHRTFSPALKIRIQMPFDVPGDSMPEPDAAVVTMEQMSRHPHPNAALLLVEVSDSSIERDYEKAFDYAAAQVPEYWIVNVQDRVVEVHRDPIVDADSPSGFAYAKRWIAAESASISVLATPEVVVKVAELVAMR